MRRTTMVTEIQPNGIGLGKVQLSDLGTEVDFASMLPYVKGREDFEVLLRYPRVLRKGQPIEANGFKTHSMMSRSLALQEELQDDIFYKGVSNLYTALFSDHPLLISYPPDLIWLGRENGLEAWESSLRRVLPNTDLGLDDSATNETIDLVRSLVINFARNYGFWRSVVKTLVPQSEAGERGNRQRELLSRIVLDWSIQNAVDSKARWMAGLTPIIDGYNPGSTMLSHRFNIAYGSLVSARIDQGLTTPAYLYTMNLNSTMFPDKWTSLLSNVVNNAKLALNDAMYDGMHVSVRHLDLISLSTGRVDTLMMLMKELKKVANYFNVPVWWSRLGPPGFAALDEGASFASFPMNNNTGDVYAEGGSGNKVDQYGKIFNPVNRTRWTVTRVIASIHGPEGGMPPLSAYWDRPRPSEEELASPWNYRVNFSKPYTVAAINGLFDQWLENVRAGETSPGRSYLEYAEPTYTSWGPR